MLLQEERSRKLQVQLLLLEDDNNDLLHQLKDEEERIDALEAEKQALEGQLEDADREIGMLKSAMKGKDRELHDLQVGQPRAIRRQRSQYG